MVTMWVNLAVFNLRTSNAVCFWVPTFDCGGELVDFSDCTFAASLNVYGKLSYNEPKHSSALEGMHWP